MKKVVYKSPMELKLNAEKNRKETVSFLRQVKKKNPKNLDDVVQSLHNEAFGSFSCLDCANCCKTIGPRLTDKDIERLAKHLKIKPSVFFEQYIVVDEDSDYVFNSNPCPFLMPDNSFHLEVISVPIVFSVPIACVIYCSQRYIWAGRSKHKIVMFGYSFLKTSTW